MYLEHRNNMNFGDLIAFSGNSLFSKIIKAKTRHHISHVGIVYDVMGRFGDRRIMLMESTTLNDAPDAIHGGFVKGVQAHFLSGLLNRYDGEVYWKPLKTKLNNTQSARVEKWLTSVHTQRVSYDMAQAMGSSIDALERLGLGRNDPDFKRLFCSELYAKAMKRAGLFDGNPSEQTPKDIYNLDILGKSHRIK